MPRKKLKTKIITLDTETYGLDGALKRIAIYDGEKVTYGYGWTDILPCIEEMYQHNYSVHIYIHNMEFDLRKIPEIWENRNVNWNATRMIDGRFVILRCKHYTFHDSFRLLPMSLDKISENFQVEHAKIDLWERVQEQYPNIYEDLGDFFNRVDVDNELYLEYLGYDVMSLYEVVYKLIELTGIDEAEFVKKMTTASISKYLFRKGYKGHVFQSKSGRLNDFQQATKCKKWYSENHQVNGKNYKEMEQLLRLSYCGGRTEVFTPRLYPRLDIKGMKIITAYHFDVNSLYPSVMINHEFPVGEPDYFKNEKAEKIWLQWLKDKIGLGFLHCKIYVPEQTIPPLPNKKGKLVFLTGYQEGCWTFVELEYAIKNCGVKIKEVFESVYFENTYPVFHDFIGTLYKLKEDGARTGNKALKQFAKLIMNVGYGFFALNREKDDVRNIEDKDKIAVNDIIYINEELGFIKQDTTIVSDTIQVQIASYVTSYARLVLLDALRKQSEKGQVFYCDTDSIVCSAQMDSGLLDKYELGKWDTEGKLYEGYFLQPKVYYEEKTDNEETIKFKGVSKSTQKTFTKQFYKNLYERMKSGKGGKVLVEKNKSLLRSISYAQKTGKDANKLEYRDKQMNLDKPQKRIMDFENNTTKAYHMYNLNDFYLFDLSIPVKKWEEFGNLFNTLV